MPSLATSPQAASAHAKQFADSPWAARLGRLGFGARGVLYVLLAYLALRVAKGHAAAQPDRQGALHTVAAQPFGHLLLVALAFGFGAYALWQLTIAAFGTSARAGSDKATKRISALAKAVSYGLFCTSTLALAAGSSHSSGGDQPAVDMTAKLMRHPGGQTLVAGIGAALIGAGAVLAWRALAGKREIELQPVRRHLHRAIDTLGLVGLIARALIIAAAGVFVMEAAIAFDPQKAKGLDGILTSFARTPAGPWLLTLVASGLFAFGAYSLAEARYAEL